VLSADDWPSYHREDIEEAGPAKGVAPPGNDNASKNPQSVTAAERAARGEGPHPQRRVATPLEVLRRAWKKASREEREAFINEIGKEEWWEG
jgi:hypothetical protein